MTVDGVPHHSGVYLRMGGPEARAHFGLIDQRYRDMVEARLSPMAQVRWLGRTKSNSNSIALSRPSTPWEPTTWPELDGWMAKAVEAMDDLFRPIVLTLDASEYVAPEDGTTVAGEDEAGSVMSEVDESP